MLAAADCLLVTEAEAVRDMSMPSKLTSYRVTGLPIVGAVHPEGGTAGELQAMGNAELCAPGDASELLAAVLRTSAPSPDSGASEYTQSGVPDAWLELLLRRNATEGLVS